MQWSGLSLGLHQSKQAGHLSATSSTTSKFLQLNLQQCKTNRNIAAKVIERDKSSEIDSQVGIAKNNAKVFIKTADNDTGTDLTAQSSWVSSPPELSPLTDMMLETNMNINAPSPKRRKEAEEALNSCRWSPSSHHLNRPRLWALIKDEATHHAQAEPLLASFLHMSVITHPTLEKSLSFLLANKLCSETLMSTHLTELFTTAYRDDPGLLDACVADIQAVKERDPACITHVQCLLFFKGFQAIQCHRIAHWLWWRGRRSLALALSNRCSETFSVYIHPAAVIGRGTMIDHATGVSIGATAVVGDNVVMLHHVTLGGSGTGIGKRHPTIGCGVLLGAGVSVLGPVVVGQCSKVGAGSVVVSDLPSYSVAVGVPARVVKKNDESVQPVKDMDMTSDFILDYVI